AAPASATSSSPATGSGPASTAAAWKPPSWAACWLHRRSAGCPRRCWVTFRNRVGSDGVLESAGENAGGGVAGEQAGSLDDRLVAGAGAVGGVAELLQVDEGDFAAEEVLEKVDPELEAGKRHAAALAGQQLQECLARHPAAAVDRLQRAARSLVLAG